jgi:hypothetical protein
MPSGRFLVIRKENGVDIVEESGFDGENYLQELFKENTKLIPTSDFNLESLMVIGRETNFPSGTADLIAVDTNGEIVIVEFKLEKNQTIRQIIAQLLDYGSHLWGYDFETFEKKVALKYFNSNLCTEEYKGTRSLIDAVKFFVENLDENLEFDEEIFRKNITKNLEEGNFVYIVVSPSIDKILKRDMEYLNFASNMRFYGVEVDYYKDVKREIFVPRSIAFEPPKRPGPRHKTDESEFLEKCDAQGRKIFRKILSYNWSRKTWIFWGSSGFSLKTIYKEKPFSLMIGYPKESGVGQTIQFPVQTYRNSLPESTFREHLDNLNRISNCNLSAKDNYPSIRVDESFEDSDADILIDSISKLLKKLKM